MAKPETTTMTDRWARVMDAARARWGKLSADDLQSVQGNAERLISVLQERYGFGRGEALDEVKRWRRTLTARVAAWLVIPHALLEARVRAARSASRARAFSRAHGRGLLAASRWPPPSGLGHAMPTEEAPVPSLSKFVPSPSSRSSCQESPS
jgi:uncharacterized protein YjbJ (UPF0337 family)